MKTAVVYYSLDENCAFIAECLGKCLDADVIRLLLKDEKKRKGFFKFFWGGTMVVFNKKPALKPVNFDPAPYDLIIIGSPVWAGTFAPPIKTFLAETGITGKKLALYTCFAGNAGKSLINLKALLPGNVFLGEIGFKNPASGNREEIQQQINEWVLQMNSG
ncbi:MAG: flavodoxin [Treponema sp.]|nr:flavodoxin [Treponema sp.]MCL2139971.1 flavodoxin [Treponema sp.]